MYICAYNSVLDSVCVCVCVCVCACACACACVCAGLLVSLNYFLININFPSCPIRISYCSVHTSVVSTLFWNTPAKCQAILTSLSESLMCMLCVLAPTINVLHLCIHLGNGCIPFSKLYRNASLHVGVSRPFVNGSVQYGVAVMCMYVCVWTCAACICV